MRLCLSSRSILKNTAVIGFLFLCASSFSCSQVGDDAEYPSTVVKERFSPPSSTKLGSTANQAWLDFREWLMGLECQPQDIVLEVDEGLGVWGLSQCTYQLWQRGCMRIHLVGREGVDYVLHRPVVAANDKAIVVLEGAGMAGLGLTSLQASDSDSFAIQEGIEFEPDKLLPKELDTLVQASSQDYPLRLFVEEDLPMSRLLDALGFLATAGAEAFVVCFYSQ